MCRSDEGIETLGVRVGPEVGGIVEPRSAWRSTRYLVDLGNTFEEDIQCWMGFPL